MWYLQIWRSDSWPECKQYSSESFCHDWCIGYSPQHPFRFLNTSVLCLYVDQVQFVILTVSKWVFKWKGKRLGVYMLQNCKDSFSQLVGIKILPPLCPVEAMRRRWLNLCLAVVCVQHHPVLDIGRFHRVNALLSLSLLICSLICFSWSFPCDCPTVLPYPYCLVW